MEVEESNYFKYQSSSTATKSNTLTIHFHLLENKYNRNFGVTRNSFVSTIVLFLTVFYYIFLFKYQTG